MGVGVGGGIFMVAGKSNFFQEIGQKKVSTEMKSPNLHKNEPSQWPKHSQLTVRETRTISSRGRREPLDTGEQKHKKNKIHEQEVNCRTHKERLTI